MRFPSSTVDVHRSCVTFFLIYFCIQLLMPLQVIADLEDLPVDDTGTGSVLIASESSSVASSFSSSSSQAIPPALPNVVISEVMWMGTDKSTADEWVEIAGVSSADGPTAARSLSGWTISIQKSTGETMIARFPASSFIASGSYLAVSNYSKEASRLNIDPYLISTSMTLPNSALLLRLRDASGALIDAADDGVGSPFAGLNPSGGGTKASMEKIDLHGGNVPSNWRTATVSRGFDEGTPIYGTPGSANGILQAFESSLSTASVSSSYSSTQSSSLSLSSSLISSSVSLVSSDSSDSFIDHNSSSSISLQPFPKLIINELLPDPKGSDDFEWIEIKNTGSGAGNLSGLTLRTGGVAHRIRTGVALPIQPNELRVILKAHAGFTLTNNGSTVSLESGSTVLDTVSYAGSAEGVSIGRSVDDSIIPFCIPTPGTENVVIPLDPAIVIESGKTAGLPPVTLNLGVRVMTGSMAGASCHFDFGDGYSIDSCNPASHTMKATGDYRISLSFTDYCSTTVVRTLTGSVYSNGSSVNGIPLVSATGALNCRPTAFSGVSITEFLPNPTGDELAGEWIEIQNTTQEVLPLCGWSLDDEAGGSKPYALSKLQMPPLSYLVFPRKQSGITLNNDHDQVRLIAPLPSGGTGVTLSVMFDAAPDDKSYASAGSGVWKWTHNPTPGSANTFDDPGNIFAPSPVRLNAALPNPKGKDTYDEWLELTNTAGWPIWLNGWKIRNKNGKELDLTGTVLAKFKTMRIPLYRAKYVLGNESDTLYLVDEKNSIRSLLSWKNAGEDIIQTSFESSGEAKHALVRQVIDGDTIVAQQEGDVEDILTRVRLLGIDAPELYDENQLLSSEGIIAKDYLRSLIINKKIELQFDTIRKDKYDRMLAYVFFDDLDIQQQLLLRGFAYAERGDDVGRRMEYAGYENLARTASTGIWSNADQAEYYDRKIQEQERWNTVKAHGISIKADLPEGLVSSGATLHIVSSPATQVYISQNSAPYAAFTGSIVLLSTQTIRAYAVAQLNDTESVRSDILQRTYVVRGEYSHATDIRISEVYPSPNKGEDEWIELENTGDSDVSLAGWKLDDIAGGGSKPALLHADAVIPAHGYLLFLKKLTKLSLNNTGDEVNLFNPQGALIDQLVFGSVKAGKSVIRQEGADALCITDTPTPLLLNTCFIQIKKSTRKSTSKSGTKSKVVNENIGAKVPSKQEKYAEAMSGVYAGLGGQLLGRNGGVRSAMNMSVLGNIVTIILSIAIGGYVGWVWRRKGA